MRILPFNAYIPDLNKIRFDALFYNKLREDFNQLFKQDLFKQIKGPCYFIIEIVDEGLSSTGLIAMTDIRDYLNQSILRHEQTILNKEKLHHTLFSARKAMIKPASLLIGTARLLLNHLVRIKKKSQPLFSVTYPDADTRHSIWVIEAERDIKKITDLFHQKIHKAIIADGHHRFATMAKLYVGSGKHRHSHILTAYFTKDQMRVAGFYRIVEKLKNTSHTQILDALKRTSNNWSPVNRIIEKKGHIHLIAGQEIYRFSLPATGNREPLPIQFSKKIIASVFKINDETKSKRIFYAESTHHLGQIDTLVQGHPGKYIFILPSLTAQEILDNKKILPPKSTFFLPRIINGLVVALDD